ncbi:hypothetical protein [Bacteroides nordii]|nr:hypothetical protein [Bacteroides nordii]
MLKRYVYGGGYEVDDDLFSDTMLSIYDAIALKGAKVVNYTKYFLFSYRAALINREKRNARARFVPVTNETDTPAAEFDSREYEEAVERINVEVMEYVRGNFDEMSVSLFEMYVGLSPDISYKRLSEMLGIPFVTVWQSIGNVKKEVVKRFEERKDFLLYLM